MVRTWGHVGAVSILLISSTLAGCLADVPEPVSKQEAGFVPAPDIPIPSSTPDCTDDACLQFVRRFEDPVALYKDGEGLGMTPDGQRIIAAVSAPSDIDPTDVLGGNILDDDIHVLAYDAESGDPQWQTVIGDPIGEDWTWMMAVSPSYAYFVVFSGGPFVNALDYRPYVAMHVLDHRTGEHVTAHPLEDIVHPRAMSVVPGTDDVAIRGYGTGDQVGTNTVAMLGPDGGLRWSTSLDEPENDSKSWHAATFQGNGTEMILVGKRGVDDGPPRTFATILNTSDGSIVREINLTGQLRRSVSFDRVDLAPGGERIIVAGRTVDGCEQDHFVMTATWPKFELVWNATAGGPDDGDDLVDSILYDRRRDRVVIAGTSQNGCNVIDFSRGVLWFSTAWNATSGELLWRDAYQETTGQFDWATGARLNLDTGWVSVIGTYQAEDNIDVGMRVLHGATGEMVWESRYDDRESTDRAVGVAGGGSSARFFVLVDVSTDTGPADAAAVLSYPFRP